MISIQEFRKCEIIVAQIKEAIEHPNADKLYVLKIDTGKEEKQLVTGIRKSYTTDELIGRKVIVVNNLETAVIRGEESQGMALAASDSERIVLLKPDRDLPVGSTVH